MRRTALGPLASPESVVRALRLGTALGQGLLSALACAWVAENGGVEEGRATVAALTACVSLLATSASIDRWVLASTLVTGIPLGLLTAWQTRTSPSLLTLGLGVAATVDVGLIGALPTYVAARLAGAPTRDALDRMAVAIGTWLAVTAGVAALLDAPRTALDVVVGLVAIGACVVGSARMIARRRWLAHVVGGREAGLAVVARGSFELGDSLPLGAGAFGDAVIVEETPAREGPFRGSVMRALVAPVRAPSAFEPWASPASRLVLVLAAVPMAAALGTLALAIVDETLTGSEYSSTPSAYLALALSTAVLAVMVVLVGTRAPLDRWVARILVLALPAGVLNGGIALMLVLPQQEGRFITLVGCSMLASLVSVPSALVIGGLLASMSAIARSVAREDDDRARAGKALAPFVIASGVVTMLGVLWQGPLAIYGGLAIVIGLAMIGATSERFRTALERRSRASAKESRDSGTSSMPGGA